MAKLIGKCVAMALPPRCPGCGIPGAADHRFCAACWSGLHFLNPPWCEDCNLPFEHDRGEGALCATCLGDPPRHTGVRAAVAYGAIARRLALKLKYGGRIGVAETMARSMVRGIPDHVDVLVPVPLHRWRLWSRGYNQAALIAASLAKQTNLMADQASLTRVRRTAPLRGRSGSERRRTVAGAFRVSQPERIAGRHIGLIDDVYTSGATADACTRVLLRAGASSVTVICWARVLPGGTGD